MKNIAFGPRQKPTRYRKMAIASWRHPRNPNTYCPADLEFDAARRFLESLDSETPPTLTHYVAKILAHCLEQYPQLNHMLRWGSLYPRKQVDVFISPPLRGVPSGSQKGCSLWVDLTSRESLLIRRMGGQPLPSC